MVGVLFMRCSSFLCAALAGGRLLASRRCASGIAASLLRRPGLRRLRRLRGLRGALAVAGGLARAGRRHRRRARQHRWIVADDAQEADCLADQVIEVG